MVKEVLLVDPDLETGVLLAVRDVLSNLAEVETCAEFRPARTRLLTGPPDLLVTNLRLRDYNGLHLVFLTEGTPTRCVVYATEHDWVLAREAQTAGAFYERLLRLPFVIPSYVKALLPHRDRRDPLILDRRLLFRGGRRCADLHILSQPEGGRL